MLIIQDKKLENEEMEERIAAKGFVGFQGNPT